MYEQLDEILKDDKLFEYAQEIIKNNNSKMVIEKVKENSILNSYVKEYKKSLLNINEADIDEIEQK